MMETVLECRIPSYIHGRSTQSMNRADQSIDSVAKVENISLDLVYRALQMTQINAPNIFIGRLDIFSHTASFGTTVSIGEALQHPN